MVYVALQVLLCPGTGAGAGLSITDGWQNTGNLIPETPKYTIKPEDMPIIPSQPFNFSQ